MLVNKEFRSRIEDATRFLETCEGGDNGSPSRPSIWVLGLEPGWSSMNQRDANLAGDEGEKYDAETEKYSVELQLKWNYNRAIFQILGKIDGHDIRDFRAFAMKARPFEKGSRGYFKGNLFPEPFNNIEAWDEETVKRTGFSTKEDYRSWLGAARFPVVHEWIEKCRPKLIIGVGISYLQDFQTICGSSQPAEEHFFEVNGYRKRMFSAKDGIAPLAVLPHVSSGSHGLNSYKSREIAAEIIHSQLLS